MSSSRPVRLWAACLIALFASACACTSSPARRDPVAAASGQGPDAVVATIGSHKITLAELDEHVAAQLRELEDQRFQIRKQGLDQMVNQELVKAEATRRNLTEEALMKEEVDAKVTPPTDEAIAQFFAQNASQLPPGSKIEDFKDRIVAFMTRQAHGDRAKAFFAELRKKGEATITLAPPPKPRVQVEAKGPSRGPADAKVTIVEFSDFECPFCSRARDVVDKVMAKYEGKVRLVFRQFPLSFHSHARKAAEASLCADAQGKFWEMHDALFSGQSKLEVAELKETAAKIGCDAAKFAACLDGGEQGKVVDADMAAAEKVGVSGTPAFFINGLSLSGAQPADEFERVIDQELGS